MAAIWESGPSSGVDRLVMLCLADFADDSGTCWPSMRRIAEKCCMTERGAQKILRRLEAEGWLEIITGNGRHGCNQYLILTQNPEPGSPIKTPNPVHPEPCSPRTAKQKPRTRVQETLNGGSPEPPLTIIDPSLEYFARETKPPDKAKRAVQLPEGWVPSDRNFSDAETRNFTEQEIQNEADRFRDYHHARGSIFKNWDAAWRTWLGNVRKYEPRRGMAGQTGTGGYGQRGSIAGAIARRRLEGKN